MATTPTRQRTSKPCKPPKLSRLHKPQSLSLEAWQAGQRREFGREQKFKTKNIGEQPVFSEFLVSNPASKSA